MKREWQDAIAEAIGDNFVWIILGILLIFGVILPVLLTVT